MNHFLSVLFVIVNLGAIVEKCHRGVCVTLQISPRYNVIIISQSNIAGIILLSCPVYLLYCYYDSYLILLCIYSAIRYSHHMNISKFRTRGVCTVLVIFKNKFSITRYINILIFTDWYSAPVTHGLTRSIQQKYSRCNDSAVQYFKNK